MTVSGQTKSIKLHYDQQEYEYGGCVGKGQNGSVHSFVRNKDPYGIVAKVMAKRIDLGARDHTAVCTSCCVRSTVLHGGHVEIMERMDGDLSAYMRDVNPALDEIAQILAMVRDQLTCIDAQGSAYMDLKCDNVLYRLQNDVLQIHLGDLDSLSQKPLQNGQFDSSFNVHCSTNTTVHTVGSANGTNPLLVEDLMTLLYMDVLSRYYRYNNKESLFRQFQGLLGGVQRKRIIDCTESVDWEQMLTIITGTEEFAQIEAFTVAHADARMMRTNGKGKAPATGTLFASTATRSVASKTCYHCLDRTTLTIKPCLEVVPATCTTTTSRAVSIDYLYYDTPANRLTKITSTSAGNIELQFSDKGKRNQWTVWI